MRKVRVDIAPCNQLEAAAGRATLKFIRRAFESAGVEFIDENGGGPGVNSASASV